MRFPCSVNIIKFTQNLESTADYSEGVCVLVPMEILLCCARPLLWIVSMAEDKATLPS